MQAVLCVVLYCITPVSANFSPLVPLPYLIASVLPHHQLRQVLGYLYTWSWLYYIYINIMNFCYVHTSDIDILQMVILVNAVLYKHGIPPFIGVKKIVFHDIGYYTIICSANFVLITVKAWCRTGRAYCIITLIPQFHTNYYQSFWQVYSWSLVDEMSETALNSKDGTPQILTWQEGRIVNIGWQMWEEKKLKSIWLRANNSFIMVVSLTLNLRNYVYSSNWLCVTLNHVFKYWLSFEVFSCSFNWSISHYCWMYST